MKINFAQAELLKFLAECAQDAYGPLPPCSVGLGDGRTSRGFISLTSFGTVISLKGTADLADMMTDAEVFKDYFPDIQGLGRVREEYKDELEPYYVHRGFLREFNLIWPQIRKSVFTKPLYVTGHSLGGALATLVAISLKLEAGIDCQCVTFGSPRVGDDAFRKFYNKLVPETIRVVHSEDLVPRVPKIGYGHVDRLIHIDSDGRILGTARTFLRALFQFGEVFLQDLDFRALADHHMVTYMHCLERLIERLERRKGGKS